MITTLTTNGMLLTQPRIDRLMGLVDLIAISLDGLPEEHNRMRASPRAFESMAGRLHDVRTAGMRFGSIFTLTLHNLDQLEQVAAFAAEQGASLLQVHPLEEVGRAREELLRHAPDDLELSYAFLEVARLQKRYVGRMRIQYDVLDRNVVRNDPQRVFAVSPQALDDWSDRPLAELVSPLIVETDGTVVPIQYGFSRNFAVGNLSRARLGVQAAEWRKQVYPAFLRLCSDVYTDVMTSSSDRIPFTNWYGRITQGSAGG